jgi:hypothetical protein
MIASANFLEPAEVSLLSGRHGELKRDDGKQFGLRYVTTDELVEDADMEEIKTKGTKNLKGKIQSALGGKASPKDSGGKLEDTLNVLEGTAGPPDDKTLSTRPAPTGTEKAEPSIVKGEGIKDATPDQDDHDVEMKG